jgi:hypothetical protein
MPASLAAAAGMAAESDGIFEKKLNSDDPRLGTWLMDYVDLLRKTKRVDETKKLGVRAAEIRTKTGPKKQD